MFTVNELGWNEFFQNQYDSHINKNIFEPGRIAVENKHRYIVFSRYGELSAEISGKLLFSADAAASFPKVGDWVMMNVFPEEQKAIIQEIFGRKTVFSRKAAGIKIEEQIVAANIDVLFIVQSLDSNFNLRRLERYLVMAGNGGIEPVVVLSKSDLCSNATERVEAVKRMSADTRVVSLSAVTGQGIDTLREIIVSSRTYAFVGSSGTGKSTLINSLAGDNIQLTNEVRQKDSRGKHTTTRREMIILPGGGIVIDTPGMREFHLWASEESIGEVFDEIDLLARDCRFSDCRHINEKDCSVLKALHSGQISSERYNSYMKLMREQEFLESKTDLNAFLEKKKKDKAQCRNIKHYMKNFNRK